MKVIKKYQNGKLYDLQTSSYLTPMDILDLKVKSKIDIAVIDNKSKRDITVNVLFEALTLCLDRVDKVKILKDHGVSI